jgi:ubiquinol-cytochrome c reductase cytochrome b subunit
VSYEDYKPLMIRPDKRGRISPLERVRAVASTWFFEDRIAPVTSTELEQQKHDGH